MKILPIHLSDDPDVLDTASGALTAPLDSAWLSALAFLGDPAPAPAGVSGGEGLPGEGALGDQGSDAGLGETAPADSGGVVALANSFVFDDAPVLPADSADAAATMASFVFAASANASAESSGFGAGVDAAVCDTDAPTPLGSGGVVVSSLHLETSAAPSSLGNGVAAIIPSADPAPPVAAPGHDAGAVVMPTVFAPATALAAPVHEGSVLAMPEDAGTGDIWRGSRDLASLANPPAEDPHAAITNAAITNAGVGSGGATAAQIQQAIGESGLTDTGAGVTVGVLSDSFNDLGGAAADEASGALPSAAHIDVIKDLGSGGSDEGRAMMQIIHDIAPGANLAFYTAFDSEQDFANGILALAAAGCKVIVDDVSYFDEPFFQNGVVAQAIQTVESEGVTYVTAAGNEASNGYQAAWTPITTSFHGTSLVDAESFGGSPVQTVTINTEGTGNSVPLILEWNQAYGSVSASTADLEILVFNASGTLIGTATNSGNGEPSNPWVEFNFSASGTYSVAIVNLHNGTDPGLIKEITEGDGLPATISGSNTGTVVGHAMTPGAITAGAVSVAETPPFGVNPPISESFSSSGAGTELLFANNGTPLGSPDALSPVIVSGVDDIHTTVPGGLSDFFGTSAASASLAGVAALILAANPALTPAQVEQIMEDTALPMANSAVSGAGLVQVNAAVADAAVPATNLNFVGIADFNGDSMSDVLWDSTNGTPTVWLMDDTSISSRSTLPDIGNSWRILSTAHFNTDGDADILLENSGGTPAIWLMNGTSISSLAALPTLGPSWQFLATADFNGDHTSDILWENTAGTPEIWLMNGTSVSSAAALPTIGPSWHFLGTGDFNGNGDSDILWENTAGTPAVWLMNGTSISSLAALPTIGPSWHFLATADFNGDGNSDILWENTAGTPAIWLMNGTSIVGSATLPTIGPSWHFVGTADFNGDGNADILWENTGGTPAIWLMNGGTITSLAALPNPGAGWHILGFGDFNDDGKSDILWENSSSAATVIWLMNGTQIQSGEFISANGTEAVSAAQVVAQMSAISELATKQAPGGNSPAISVAATTAGPAAGDAWSSAAGDARAALGQPPTSATIPVAAWQTVSGDAGNDTFIFNTNSGHTAINNFAPASDTIEINHSVFANVADVMAHATQIGADTVIAEGANDTITLHNVMLGQLHQGNFIIS